jgi:hypothetical protein
MVGGFPDVPPGCATRIPRLACVVALVDDDFDSGWCEGGSIVIELPVELGLSTQSWVTPRRSQEVERSLGLFDKAAPQVDGEIVVSLCKASEC